MVTAACNLNFFGRNNLNFSCSWMKLTEIQNGDYWMQRLAILHYITRCLDRAEIEFYCPLITLFRCSFLPLFPRSVVPSIIIIVIIIIIGKKFQIWKILSNLNSSILFTGHVLNYLCDFFQKNGFWKFFHNFSKSAGKVLGVFKFKKKSSIFGLPSPKIPKLG